MGFPVLVDSDGKHVWFNGKKMTVSAAKSAGAQKAWIDAAFKARKSVKGSGKGAGKKRGRSRARADREDPDAWRSRL